MLRFLLAALALPALLAFQKPAAQQPRRKLLVISMDGLDARFLSEPQLHVKAPNIRALMKSGASATVVGVVPSDTWPAHAAMVTGVSPWQNGITAADLPASPGDRFFAASDIRTTTLWDAASKAGLTVATVFWPSTLGAKVAFDFPAYWVSRQGNEAPFPPIAAHSTPAGITDKVAQMFPAFDKQLWDDSSSADAALYLLSAGQPDLMLVHMGDIESEQSDTTALSIYAREIVENDDDLIGQILKKIGPGTIVAIVSDHGFENANRIVRPKVLLRQAGVKGNVEVADGLIGTNDPAVAEALRKLATDSRKSGIAREIKMTEVRARAPMLGRWVAAFDTLPDYVASDEDHGSGVGAGPHSGVRALWPTRPNYRSILILNGPGVKTVKLGEVDMLQLAPTFAEIIGVRLPAAKSQSLWRTVTH
ncbi:MAG: alkaline phosphatase family protein [Acidobacteriota bacterium]|nr:alkaline phosphatase family protein [Acidobacteriota bacterium]